LFDWIGDIISGIGDAIASAFASLWEKISSGIFDIFFKWLYELVFNAIADFFSMIGNMGTELFDLPFVQAVLKLFQYFGWALFAAGLTLFWLCDVSVGLRNLPGYFPEDTANALANLAGYAIWWFYLPAQILIFVSGCVVNQKTEKENE